MKDLASGTVAAPLSRYAPFRRAGDVVYFSGIIAADPATMRIIKGYSDLPPEARKLAGEIPSPGYRLTCRLASESNRSGAKIALDDLVYDAGRERLLRMNGSSQCAHLYGLRHAR